jgi:cell division protein FtsW
MTVQTQTRARWIENVPHIDYVLVGVVVLLLLVGLIMIWSVTFPFSVDVGRANPQSDFVKHLAFAAFGLIVMLILARIDYHLWQRFAIPLMILTIGALILVLFMPPINGARRWLFPQQTGASIQPAEIAKLTVIIYMATWLSSKGEKLRQVTYGLLPFAIFVGVVTGLVMRQPNLSTAMIIALCAMAMFFISGADLIQFVFLVLVGGATVAIIISRTSYQLTRVDIFSQDPLALTTPEGFQIVQTIVALGSGGLLGRGLGSGYAKMGWVPASHTDSIFALLGEELGLVGTWSVLILFLVLAYRGFRIATRARDPFGQVLASGITFWLIFQALVNIAVVTATMPFTGVPLPFISFGGSALVSVLAAVGVLLNISRGERAPLTDNHATFDFGWRNRGTRVSRADRRRNYSESNSRRTRAR